MLSLYPLKRKDASRTSPFARILTSNFSPPASAGDFIRPSGFHLPKAEFFACSSHSPHISAVSSHCHPGSAVVPWPRRMASSRVGGARRILPTGSRAGLDFPPSPRGPAPFSPLPAPGPRPSAPALPGARRSAAGQAPTIRAAGGAGASARAARSSPGLPRVREPRVPLGCARPRRIWPSPRVPAARVGPSPLGFALHARCPLLWGCGLAGSGPRQPGWAPSA